MFSKTALLAGMVLLLVVSSLGFAGTAFAWSDCGTSHVVRWGDTLGGIARQCGTSVAALRLANPNLGYWLYAGQTIWLPGAYLDNGDGYATYVVARGDTLKALAGRFGTSMAMIGSLNGLANYNLIYEGQRLSIPSGDHGTVQPPPPVPGGTYMVQRGDTLRKIADRMGVALVDLISVNPQIRNPSLIYAGQAIHLPEAPTLYTVQRRDTLKIIADRFGTSVDNLLALNPQIWNADWIYAGQTVRIR